MAGRGIGARVAVGLGIALLAARAGLSGDVQVLRPLALRPADGAAATVRLRGDHELLLHAPRKGAPLSVRVEAVQIGRYADEVVLDAPGVPDAKRVLAPGQSVVMSFAAPHQGVVRLDVSTHGNAVLAAALPPSAWLAAEASQARPLHVIGRAERLHFFVPPSAERFAVFARGGGGRENVRISVFDPEGGLARQVSVPGDATGVAKVEVPAAHRGKAWWLKADRPPELDGVFEDAYLWLSDDVPPYVSPQAGGLLVPFVHGLTQPPVLRREGGVTLAFPLNVPRRDGTRLRAALARADGQAVAESVDERGESVALKLAPGAPLGTHPLAVQLLGADGATLAEGRSSVTVTPRLVFVGEPQPLIRVELVERAGQPPVVAVARNLAGEGLALEAQVELRRTPIPDPPGGPRAERLVEAELGLVGDGPGLVPPPPGLADGHYQWKAVARVPGGEIVDVQAAHFLLKAGSLFSETRPAPGGPLPVPQEREGAPFPGFFAFVPQAADAIPYNSRPTGEDLDRPLRITLARGEYEPATFGILSLAELPNVEVRVEPLRHERSGPALPLDVRLARHWPQRVSWRTTSYRIIPEMLEPNKPFAMTVGQVRQVWLTAHAAADAAPGLYAGRVTVEAGSRRWTRDLQARVLPFQLLRPKGVHWGLYPDSARWSRYPDEQVRAELRDVVAHGITTLMLYPVVHARLAYANGKLAVDAGEFVRHTKIAREVGLRPPWVMSLQALGGAARRLLPGKPLTDPEFKKLYQAIASHFVRLARENDFGECVWHAIDEPWSDEAVKQAVIELGYLKELGVTTFTTAGPVAPELDKVLDVRCFSIGHLLGSAGVLAEGARKTRESGDRLWFYGSGCYTGQDGNAIQNRFITGFLFWRSGAEGAWSWTFLRAKDDPLDDFDGQRQREAKDACIVYPSTDQAAPTPALQWEGIREGVDDYCYLYTLQQLAKQRGGPKGGAALAELARLAESIPVRRDAGDFSAARADELRGQITRTIEALLAGD